nr:hypothetical protein [uncultured Devosia sp.]
MKFMASMALAGTLMVQPALAQSIEGQWFSRTELGGIVVETITVITGNSYISNSQSVVGGFPYAISQTGEAMFTPPDNLRLVVLDWQPRWQNGGPVRMPPNSNYTILSLDQTQMIAVDNICTMNASPAACTLAFQRM